MEFKEVLILTGPCGVGKTTLAKAWAKMKYGAVVECDLFTEWIFDPGFPHWSEEEEKLVANISAGITEEYLEFGLPVAIENVWSPYGIKVMTDRLNKIPDVRIKSVRLICNQEENQRRDHLRPAEDRMNERVKLVADELASYKWPHDTLVLDTTSLGLAESVLCIDKI